MKKIFLALFILLSALLMFPISCFGKTKYEAAQEEYQELFNDLETIDQDYLEEWFLSYVELCDTYDTYKLKRETIDSIYSEEEIILMERVIETEVHGGTFIQKVNVANVLLNRFQYYESFRYLDMVEVITDKNQFCYNKVSITDETKNALNFAFEIKDTTNKAIAFRSDKNPKEWNNWEYSFYDGAHYFYKKKEGK